MKRFSLVLVLFIVSFGSAFAAPKKRVMGPSDVFVASPRYAFELEGRLLWQKWVDSDRCLEINSDYRRGFDVGIAMICASRGVDLRANWLRFHAAGVAFDELTLRGGLYIDYGCYLHTNLFAGVELARLKERYTRAFVGAGPLFGFDLSYQLTTCLQLHGHTEWALLVDKQTVPAFEGRLGVAYSTPCAGGRFVFEIGY